MFACFSALDEANEAFVLDSIHFLSSYDSSIVLEIRYIKWSFGVYKLPSIEKIALKSSCDMNEVIVVNIKEKK